MRGVLALRYVLPALFASVVATAVSWLALPDAPTYLNPGFPQLDFKRGLGSWPGRLRAWPRSAMFGLLREPTAISRRAGAG